jgi:hypothetical protein
MIGQASTNSDWLNFLVIFTATTAITIRFPVHIVTNINVSIHQLPPLIHAINSATTLD